MMVMQPFTRMPVHYIAHDLIVKDIKSNMNFYELEAKKINGETVSMSDFEGKPVVVVNTASKCGLTPQYEGLEELYQKYRDEGLVILGFPCNQFANQEPGSSEDIEEFCQVNYGVSFTMFEKVDVNGKNAHPIFKFLKSKLSGGLLGSRIKWNFTKFVIDKNGKPVKRFAPTTAPQKMEQAIKKVL
jgi:glutathione peroxidase